MFGLGSSGGGKDFNSNNDLELGEDVKLASPSSFYKFDNNRHDAEQNQKEFLTGIGKNPKQKNVFTLKFDPNNRRINSTTKSPSPLNRDTFKIEQDQMEAHALSSYRLPSPRQLNSDESNSPYVASLEDLQRYPSPTTPGVPPLAHTQDAHQHHPSSGSSKVKLSAYFDMDKTGNTGTETPISPREESPVEPIVRPKVVDSHSKPSLYVETEGRKSVEQARPSFESSMRRASTIDDQQRSIDWEPPTLWGTSQSPRASPIPFSERRLSNSIARTSLSIQRSRSRSRHASFGAAGGIGNSKGSARPSFEGSPLSSSILPRNTPAGQIIEDQNLPSHTHRASACYASVFSFENDERHEEEGDDDEEEIQPIPTDLEEVRKA